MKKNVLSIIALIIALVAGLFILTGCDDKEKKKDERYFNAIKNNDVEAIKEFRKDGTTLLAWIYDSNSGLKNQQAPIDKSDELQKIVYSFNCNTYEHTRALNYEPLESDSDIPAYEQKCIWTCSQLPELLEAGDSFTITLEGKYVGGNEYAGITDYVWIYANDERVSIKNNDGYTKDNCFVGNGKKEGTNESLKTSFTITVPDKDDSKEDFEIFFETYAGTTVCGTTVFRYHWKQN